jgi:hypothetical protein
MILSSRTKESQYHNKHQLRSDKSLITKKQQESSQPLKRLVIGASAFN